MTQFTDGREPKPRSREVFCFHRPPELAKKLTQKPLRARLQLLGALDGAGLRDCQVEAIAHLGLSPNSLYVLPAARFMLLSKLNREEYSENVLEKAIAFVYSSTYLRSATGKGNMP